MRNAKLLTLSLLAVTLAGCGGSGGLGLSGGSIPIGTIKGLLVLPNGQPMTGAVVTAHILPMTQLTSVNATVASDGRFTVTNVPANKNIKLSFAQGNVTLSAVVPIAQDQANQATDIGSVTALSTVVAQSLATETAGVDPTNIDQIVSSQFDQLNSEIDSQGQSQNEQELEITDQSQLDLSADSLIGSTANSELAALAANPGQSTAGIALDGLIGNIAAAGATGVGFTPTQRSALISAQLAPQTYDSATIASALNTAGISSATASEVQAADAAQRNLLPDWNQFGLGITPFEAFAIARRPVSSSGFGLTPAQTVQFLTALGA